VNRRLVARSRRGRETLRPKQSNQTKRAGRTPPTRRTARPLRRRRVPFDEKPPSQRSFPSATHASRSGSRPPGRRHGGCLIFSHATNPSTREALEPSSRRRGGSASPWPRLLRRQARPRRHPPLPREVRRDAPPTVYISRPVPSSDPNAGVRLNPSQF
jgi:hypothetical protein